MNWLKSIFSGLRSTLGSIFDGLFGDGALDSMSKKITSSGMTGADKEAAETQLANQQILNEQEYQRKIDFYEMYESPQAQVRQMKDAGLNPALMYSGSPSVSASGGIGSPGTASASASASESFSSIISAVAGMALQSQQLKLQDKWKERELDLESERVAMAKSQTEAEVRYKNLISQNQEVVNKWTEPLLELKSDNVQADIDLKMDELRNNRPVQRLLARSNISLNNARTSLTMYESKIAEVESKNRNRILQAQALVTELQGALLQTQNQFEAQLLQSQLNIAAQQVTSLILSNGISAKDFNYYDSNRKFDRWTTGIATGAKALGAIASFTGAGALVGKAAGLFPQPSAVSPSASPIWTPSSYNFDGTTYRAK